MDVQCSQCGSEYELEEHRVPAEGATVKCTNCGHLFKVRKKTILLAEALHARSANQSTPARSADKGHAPTLSSEKPTTARMEPNFPPEKSFFNQPVSQRGPDSWGIEPRGAAGGDVRALKRKSSMGKWVLGLFLLVSFAAGLVWYLQFPESFWSVVEVLQGKDPQIAAKAMDTTRHAHERYLMDSSEQLSAAKSELQNLETNPKQIIPEAVALLAQISITQAEKYKERIQRIDQLMKTLPKDRSKDLPAQNDPAAEKGNQPVRSENTLRSLQKERASLIEIADLAMEDARKDIARLEQLDPQSNLLHRAKANYLRVSGSDRFEILAEIKLAAASKPDDPELWFIEGALLAEQPAMHFEAVALLEKVVKIEPNRLQARYRLAHMLVKTDRDDQAETQLQEILASNPAHEQARALLAEIPKPKQPDTSPLPAAAVEAPEERKSQPKKASIKTYDDWMKVADGYLQRGNAEKAIEAYDAALDLRPEDVEALSGKGLGYLDLGENMLAIEWFRRALQKSQRFAVAIMGIAEAYKYMGDRQSALVYYQKYLEINPGGEEAQIARRNIEKLK